MRKDIPNNLYISLGGMGASGLQAVKKELSELFLPAEHGAQAGTPDCLDVLAIDVDRYSFEDAAYPSPSLSKEQCLLLRQPHPAMDPAWIKRVELNPSFPTEHLHLFGGSTGNPNLGKLLLLANADRITNALRRKLAHFAKQQVFVHLFCGLGGGMAGGFYDLCCLIRQAAEQTGVGVMLLGYLFTPDVLTEGRGFRMSVKATIAKTAAAVFAELEQNMNPNVRYTLHTPEGAWTAKEMPIDFCHLISLPKEGGNRDAVLRKTAAYACGYLGGSMEAMAVNFAAVAQAAGCENRFVGLAVGRVRFPRQMIASWQAAHAAGVVAEQKTVTAQQKEQIIEQTVNGLMALRRVLQQAAKQKDGAFAATLTLKKAKAAAIDAAYLQRDQARKELLSDALKPGGAAFANDLAAGLDAWIRELFLSAEYGAAYLRSLFAEHVLEEAFDVFAQRMKAQQALTRSELSLRGAEFEAVRQNFTQRSRWMARLRGIEEAYFTAAEYLHQLILQQEILEHLAHCVNDLRREWDRIRKKYIGKVDIYQHFCKLCDSEKERIRETWNEKQSTDDLFDLAAYQKAVPSFPAIDCKTMILNGEYRDAYALRMEIFERCSREIDPLAVMKQVYGAEGDALYQKVAARMQISLSDSKKPLLYADAAALSAHPTTACPERFVSCCGTPFLEAAELVAGPQGWTVETEACCNAAAQVHVYLGLPEALLAQIKEIGSAFWDKMWKGER